MARLLHLLIHLSLFVKTLNGILCSKIFLIALTEIEKVIEGGGLCIMMTTLN